MDFLLGLLTAVVFFIAVIAVYFVGYKQGKRHQPANKPLPDEEKQKMERFNKHFKELFAYDVDTAIQRKKVT
jgi:cbb3-type cytochrome oxidase subunit 3